MVCLAKETIVLIPLKVELELGLKRYVVSQFRYGRY